MIFKWFAINTMVTIMVMQFLAMPIIALKNDSNKVKKAALIEILGHMK